MKRLTKLLPILFFIIPSLSGCSTEDNKTSFEPVYNDNGELKCPYDAKSLVNRDYQEVIDGFKKAGYKNFYLNYLNDVLIGLFNADGGIDAIRINDSTDFSTNSYFSKENVVFIDIHSKKDGYELDVEEIDGKLPIFFSSNDFNKNDRNVVGGFIEEIGFTNIGYTPIKDCSSKYSLNYNRTEKVLINDSVEYEDYSFFNKTEKIDVRYHTIEGDYCSNGLSHTPVDVNKVEPTCTEKGHQAGQICSVCNKTLSGLEEIPATGHAKVVDLAAIAPTCISVGRTETSHCSVCGDILSVTEPLPIDNTNHINTTVIPGIKANCQSTGISDGLFCNDCNQTVIEQVETPIDLNNHTNVVNDPAIPATESSSGLSAGSHCGDCGTVIVKQQTTTWTPTLSWLLTHVPSWEQAAAFADAYNNQTINFNGWLYLSQTSSGYSTVYDITISAGTYSGSHTDAYTLFLFERVSQADPKIKGILGCGRGTNVSVTCKVIGSKGQRILCSLSYNCSITTR